MQITDFGSGSCPIPRITDYIRWWIDNTQPVAMACQNTFAAEPREPSEVVSRRNAGKYPYGDEIVD